MLASWWWNSVWGQRSQQSVVTDNQLNTQCQLHFDKHPLGFRKHSNQSQSEQTGPDRTGATSWWIKSFLQGQRNGLRSSSGQKHTGWERQEAEERCGDSSGQNLSQDLTIRSSARIKDITWDTPVRWSSSSRVPGCEHKSCCWPVIRNSLKTVSLASVSDVSVMSQHASTNEDGDDITSSASAAVGQFQCSVMLTWLQHQLALPDRSDGILMVTTCRCHCCAANVSMLTSDLCRGKMEDSRHMTLEISTF